jgi:hypothetical protein
VESRVLWRSSAIIHQANRVRANPSGLKVGGHQAPPRSGSSGRERLLDAGAAFGLVQVGAMTYSLNEFESGWIPSPTPGIYEVPELRSYREWLGALSFEGMNPLHGSFFSENIEDFYTTPYALGYGKAISFDHEFVGRDALMKARDNVTQKRVTLDLDRDQVRQVWGGPALPFDVSYGRYRVEADGRLIGVAFCAGTVPTVDTVLSLALVDKKYAMPGTEVTFVWGEHPGPGTAPDADLGFSRIKATVQPSPYNEFTHRIPRQGLMGFVTDTKDWQLSSMLARCQPWHSRAAAHLRCLTQPTAAPGGVPHPVPPDTHPRQRLARRTSASRSWDWSPIDRWKARIRVPDFLGVT